MEEGQKVQRNFRIIQSMIDISADRLTGLRTQCSTSVELTQREIRTLEGKLLKLFSKELAIKIRFKDWIQSSDLKNLPSLSQWLEVVGLCPESIQSVTLKVKSVEALQEKPQVKLKHVLVNCLHHDEELRKLTIALRNLKRYSDILLESGNDVSSVGDIDLPTPLDSWDWSYVFEQSSPPHIWELPHLKQDSAFRNGNVPYIDQFGSSNSFGNSDITVSYSVTPVSKSPLLSPSNTPIHKWKDQNVQKSPGSFSAGTQRYNYSENDSVQTISKSRSHDSQLFTLSSSNSASSSPLHRSENGPVSRRRSRLSTVPGLEYVSASSSLYSSPSRSPPYMTTSVTTITAITSDSIKMSDSCTADNAIVTNGGSIPIPRSPRTPTITRVMGHDVAHRFFKHFSFNKPCDYCSKPIIMNTGLKCRECKYRCHRDCENKVPESCRPEPIEYLHDFKKGPATNESPLSCRHTAFGGHHSPSLLSQIERRVKAVVNMPFLAGADSAQMTNNHSSAPSSPASFVPNHIIQPPATASAILTQKQLFDFSSDVVNREKEQAINTQVLLESNPISDSDVTTDSDKTVNRDDSQDSNQTWDSDCVDKAWPRQYSVSMKEWEISWDELKMGDKLGVGHFGTVYRGYWHGDVAIKLLNMECSADEKMLENFKSEVSTFRKTRHDNLILFMGACMKPPRLAIVTSMMHGMTLYKYIHLRKDKFSMSKTTIIAQQISQGMGYLHAKGIVHKDLRTKNIFLEKEKVIITDFGLFSVTKLCFKNRMQHGLIIPPGWLCYLSPEIMRNLRVHVRPDDEHLPFSNASDIYAFGTVWYELLCGDWPFSSQDPETIIWQVGKGMKPSLANLEASRDVKDILMHCWSYQVNKRPDFTSLLKTLDKLPKKRLARSPSHPVHLSRSAESMF